MNLAAIAFAAQTATVHFVGLTVFIPPPPSVISSVTLDQPSPSPEFVAVMPNVPSHIMLPADQTAVSVPATTGRKVATSRSTITDGPVRSSSTPLNGDVEHHEAFLIFQSKNLIDVNAWEV